MENINVYVIDDELSSINSIKRKLDEYYPELMSIKSFQDPLLAMTNMTNNYPELIFLDISMPNMNGFEVLELMPDYKGEIIFITAYDEYALEAFKYCAIGYLLKPLDVLQFKKTVSKALERINQKQSKSQIDIILEHLKLSKMGIKKITIPSMSGYQFIEMHNILYCQASDKYTIIYLTDNSKIVSSKGFKYYVELLSSATFFRCHRSYLVNLDYVKKYMHDGVIELKSGIQVPVSRSRKDELLITLKNK